MGITNPYWTELQGLIASGACSYNGATHTISPSLRHRSTLNGLETRYSPTISDPTLVEQVAVRCGPSVVEVDAGTAYWSSLLRQCDVATAPFEPFPRPKIVTTAYDINPPTRYWHPTERLARLRVDIRSHTQDTLMCMSDDFPYPKFKLSLQHYFGEMVIVSGTRSPLDDGIMSDLLQGFALVGEPLRGMQRWRSPRRVYVFRRRAPEWARTPTQKMEVVGAAA